MGAFRLTLDGSARPRGPHRLRRHGGDAEARAPAPRRRLPGPRWTIRRRWQPALEALAADFQPIDDLAPARPIGSDTARALLRKALARDRRRRNARHARRRIEGGAAWTRRLSSMSARRQTGRGERCGAALAHDSAELHVTGRAPSISTTCASPKARCMSRRAMRRRAPAAASPRSISMPCAVSPGVVAVLTARRYPGRQRLQPGDGRRSDPRRREDRVSRPGGLRRRRRNPRRRAPRGASGAASRSPPNAPSSPSTMRSPQRSRPPSAVSVRARRLPNGAGRAPRASTRRQSRIGGQEHFYLEGQVALAVPEEGGGMLVYSSTQHPTEVQHCVAKMLARPRCARSSANAAAWAAASAARKARRRNGRRLPRSAPASPAGRSRCRLDRDDDMIMTGKRHDFRIDYAGGLRRRRACSRAVDVALLSPLRLLGRSLARRQRPRHVPCRQRLLLSGSPHPFAPAAHQHGVEHRLSRLRRPAGHDVRRAHDGCDRHQARPRSARCAQAQFLSPRAAIVRPMA